MLRQSMRIAVAAAVTSAVLATGCIGSKSKAGSAAPVQSDVIISTDYVVKTGGDLDLATSGKVPVRVVAIRADDPQFRGVTLLSVGPREPIKGNGVAFRVAFDLTGYGGNGRYSIRAGSPRDLVKAAGKGSGAGAPDQSNVLVQVWPGGDVQTPPQVFDEAVEPCPLETKDGGRTGTLRCPKVTNSSGKVLSLEMRWGSK